MLFSGLFTNLLLLSHEHLPFPPTLPPTAHIARENQPRSQQNPWIQEPLLRPEEDPEACYHKLSAFVRHALKEWNCPGLAVAILNGDEVWSQVRRFLSCHVM
jgi:hypothetical protein